MLDCCVGKHQALFHHRFNGLEAAHNAVELIEETAELVLHHRIHDLLLGRKEAVDRRAGDA